MSLLPLLGLLLAPALYWDQGVDTAGKLRELGVDRLAVPPARLNEWRGAGFTAQALGADERKQRHKLDAPGVDRKILVASPTQRPFVVANGWRYLREPDARFVVEAKAAGAALAAAEAWSFGADSIVVVEGGSVAGLAPVFAVMHDRPANAWPDLAQVGVVDDGSAIVEDAVTLLSRGNILWRPVRAPDPGLTLNLRIGSPEYPIKLARDPYELKQKVRHVLGDEQRALRIFGTEVVLARVQVQPKADGGRARVHLINYGGGVIDALRLRLQGNFRSVSARGDQGGADAKDVRTSKGFTELTAPPFTVYAIVDFEA